MNVSVVIPAYNEEKYILDCLKSIVNQNISPDEIIVVDNNCKDKTAQIARKMGAKVVAEKNQGMIFARNTGFDSAKYEIIASCDADVIAPPNWIERIKLNFETSDIDALSGPVIYYDSIFPSLMPAKIYIRCFQLLLKGNGILLGPHYALRKKVWKKVKPLICLDDKRVHEDIDLSLKIIKTGGKIANDEKLIVKTSARRIKTRPLSFFVDYPIRIVKTFWINRG